MYFLIVVINWPYHFLSGVFQWRWKLKTFSHVIKKKSVAVESLTVVYCNTVRMYQFPYSCIFRWRFLIFHHYKPEMNTVVGASVGLFHFLLCVVPRSHSLLHQPCGLGRTDPAPGVGAMPLTVEAGSGIGRQPLKKDDTLPWHSSLRNFIFRGRNSLCDPRVPSNASHQHSHGTQLWINSFKVILNGSHKK